MYKFFIKDTHINSYIAIQRIGSLKHFHWETIGVQQVLPIEPGVAAEDLVGALAGQGHLVVPLQQATEIEQGCVHIGHARKVLHPHRVRQQIGRATSSQPR